MENGELLYPGQSCEAAGLKGCEVVFGFSKMPIPFQKCGFNKKMIRIFDELFYLFYIGFIIGHIGNIADLLTGCDVGYLFGQLA